MVIDSKGTCRLKKRWFNGYSSTEVDAYVTELCRKIRSLQSENSALVEKVRELTGKLDSFIAKEESIRNALFMAEKLSSSCIKDAQEKADKVLHDAVSKSKEMIANFKYKAMEQKDVLSRLRFCVKEYQSRLLLLFKEQLSLLREFATKDASYSALCTEVCSELDKISEERDIVSSSAVTPADDTGEHSKDNSDDAGEDFKESSLSDSTSEKFKDLKFGSNYVSRTPVKKSFFDIFKRVT